MPIYHLSLTLTSKVGMTSWRKVKGATAQGQAAHNWRSRGETEVSRLLLLFVQHHKKALP